MRINYNSIYCRGVDLDDALNLLKLKYKPSQRVRVWKDKSWNPNQMQNIFVGYADKKGAKLYENNCRN